MNLGIESQIVTKDPMLNKKKQPQKCGSVSSEIGRASCRERV